MTDIAARRADLFATFDRLGIATTTHEHVAVFTVAESQHVKDTIPGGHTKNLFLKDKKSRLFLVVALGSAVIDLKRLHEVIGANGRLSFGSGELLEEVWGVKPGSVTPFGAIADPGGRVTVVLDQAMMEHEVLNYHPLENTATTSIARADLVTFLKATGHDPLILPVSQPPA
ncbi:prolyl-tRNA synthetase associated domain-containing protein [Phreatobacter aquaticus]|uniref:Prolyl-tRNA synthetase associated domain-containing protein n=1 Tax=Phreatobacter aquaticus TaxID=2570229 RepID=A0A4D7Q9R6_9HYPH|nr:YbaK/EbsC family protein [Phreatobacter aquaticus]QCK84870.1 prolyl-tRNA synthetase associated domain-containing protein [Phreatobacter aquaticus]